MKRGEGGAEDRLAAAIELQKRLEAILAGEPPFDIFVRWKPLAEQPIGWDPDINDGVRLNIRPFLASDLPGGRTGAGVLRWKPNIKWAKDRGKEPERAKAEFPWFWGWDEKSKDFMGGKGFDGNRWNDCHYTNKVKTGGAQCGEGGEEVMSTPTGYRRGVTPLEALRASLAHAARYDSGDVVAPAAVLWTDADGQWLPLVGQLRGLMPELLTLGEYDAGDSDRASDLAAVRDRASGAGGQVPSTRLAGGHRAGDLHAGCGPTDASCRRGMSRRPQAAGRASVPRDGVGPRRMERTGPSERFW